MISSVITDFRSSISFGKADEVDLFRELAKAIVKNSTSTFIDETHGGKVCNVNFTSATGKAEICEISDLLIVSHSATGGRLRATFWQAKKQAVSKWLNVTSTGSQLDFKGQFNQWDLLSRRPSISGVASFSPPSYLLSSFSSPSIGSFGVFHEKASLVEVAYSVAEFLACPSPAAKHPTLAINGYLDKYHAFNGEVLTKRDLVSFLSALFEFQVGALLDPSQPSHKWLARWVMTKTAGSAAPTAVAALRRFLGEDVGDDSNAPTGATGLSILIVEASDEA